MENDSFSLYRYRTIDKHLIDALVNQTLYFATPVCLNDPFDCLINQRKIFEQAIATTNETHRKELLSIYVDTKHFFSNWNTHIHNSGLCCFSKEANIPLLWAHYADGHKGLCIEYTFFGTDFAPDGNGPFAVSVMGDVQYIANPILQLLLNHPIHEIEKAISKPETKDGLVFMKALLRNYLFSKSPSWSYEQEWRFIRMKSGLYKPRIDRPLISKICFGLRTSEEDKNLILKLAQQYCANVKFSHMVHDDTEFGFREHPF